MVDILIFLLLSTQAVRAEEPGYLRNENPPSRPPPSRPAQAPPPEAPPQAQPEPSPEQMLLETEFRRAKGLNGGDVRSLSFQRVACSRRIFSPSGLQIQGDADLKVTDVGTDFIAAELPSYFSFVSFGGFNPFQNKIADVDTVSATQLLSVRGWTREKPLKLKKYVNVSSVEESLPMQMVLAIDELRVIQDTYPTTFIVRETIYTDPKLVVYFICQ